MFVTLHFFFSKICCTLQCGVTKIKCSKVKMTSVVLNVCQRNTAKCLCFCPFKEIKKKKSAYFRNIFIQEIREDAMEALMDTIGGPEPEPKPEDVSTFVEVSEV